MLRAPAGRLLAPMLPVLVPLLRRDRELELTDEQAAFLMRMSAATFDRKLADPDPGPHLGRMTLSTTREETASGSSAAR